MREIISSCNFQNKVFYAMSVFFLRSFYEEVEVVLLKSRIEILDDKWIQKTKPLAQTAQRFGPASYRLRGLRKRSLRLCLCVEFNTAKAWAKALGFDLNIDAGRQGQRFKCVDRLAGGI